MDLEYRISGFANANGKKFKTANQAYKHFLSEDGNDSPADPTEDFKTWLETAKNSGNLDKLLKDTGAIIKKTTPDTAPVIPPEPEKKKFSVSPKMIIGVAIGIGVVGLIIFLVRRKKTDTGTSAPAPAVNI